MMANHHHRHLQQRSQSFGGLFGAMSSFLFVFYCLLATPLLVDAYSVSQSGANLRSSSSSSSEQQQQQQQAINNGIKGGGCQSDRLVVYKVVLHTYWTRDLFPKHYPDWKPVAQWTKTVGEFYKCVFDPHLWD